MLGVENDAKLHCDKSEQAIKVSGNQARAPNVCNFKGILRVEKVLCFYHLNALQISTEKELFMITRGT